MDYLIARAITVLGLLLIPGCSWRRVTISEETNEPIELPVGHIKTYSLSNALKARDYYRAVDDKNLLAKTLRRIVSLAPDQQTLESVLYELGTVLLALEKYEEAQKVLGEYVSFFPGSDRIVEARYLELLAHYRDIRAPHHDQSRTREALSRAKAFLDEFEGESDHDEEVESIIVDCYEHLFDREMSIVEFYLHKYEYTESKTTLTAAERRVGRVYEELGAHLTAEQKNKLADFENRLKARIKQSTGVQLTVTPVAISTTDKKPDAQS